jgi:hypothetical protein
MGSGFSAGRKRKSSEESRRAEQIRLEEARKKEEAKRVKEAERQRIAEERARQKQQLFEKSQQLEEVKAKELDLLRQQEKLAEERKVLEAEAQKQEEKHQQALQEEERRRNIELELQRRHEELRRLEESLAQREVALKAQEANTIQRAHDKEVENALLSEEPTLLLIANDGEAPIPGETRRLLFSHTSVDPYGTQIIPFNTALEPGWSVSSSGIEDNTQHRFLRIFVCSSLEGDAEHALLRTAVFPRLISSAARRGVALHFVDLRDALHRAEGTGAGAAWEARTVGLLLRTARECAPWVVGLVGDGYGAALGDDVCRRLEAAGHAWVAEEGLAPAAVVDVLARYTALRGPPPDPAAPAACFLLQRRAAAKTEVAGGDMAVAGEGAAGTAGAAAPAAAAHGDHGPAGDAGTAVAAAAGDADDSSWSDAAAWREEIESAAARRGAQGVRALDPRVRQAAASAARVRLILSFGRPHIARCVGEIDR